MSAPHPFQKIQDWFTQIWVINFGRKINSNEYEWLMGNFGKTNFRSENYIDYLSEKENLIIYKDIESKGLIISIEKLGLSNEELSILSDKVVEFYEKTSEFELHLSVNWNPLFKPFGVLISKLFSERLNQLNIPVQTKIKTEIIDSEIIKLIEPKSKETKYTIWLRTNLTEKKIVYFGIYGIGKLPSGKSCVKAVFPLPNGNATVFMTPSVGKNGELILSSSGKKFGDAGFYFLLNDNQNNIWSKYVPSFHDELIIGEKNENLFAEQTLLLWKKRALTFNYEIKQKK